MSYEIYRSFNVSQAAYETSKVALNECKNSFEKIDKIREYNQLRINKAFNNAQISSADFQIFSGYGYSDTGREAVENIFAEVFSAEQALVRIQFSSGTQVLSTMLKGILRPHDRFLIVSGEVYDTLKPTIGISQTEDHASLKDFLIEYDQLDLTAEGEVDIKTLKSIFSSKNTKYKAVYIQRSRGYSIRPALTNKKIAEICQIIKDKNPQTIIMLDNCYGELVERAEPLKYGVDIMAGSLIKNPGAGIAPSGGYIAGKEHLVELCAEHMTATGVGSEIGPSLGFSKSIAQGIYLAPQMVATALKIAVFAAKLFAREGYEVEPEFDDIRGDIVQTINFGDSNKLIKFCQSVQESSAIDSQYAPIPSPMPGYDCDIIMASGSFTQGSSIELSADGPLRPPYTAFLQGGLNFESGFLACMRALDKLWQEA
ncbi:MAG: hypothetical protein GX326_04505 [Clostridiaceae bacterium]|nr:hypothetical protein [Clostridiaceae bacterium]